MTKWVFYANEFGAHWCGGDTVNSSQFFLSLQDLRYPPMTWLDHYLYIHLQHHGFPQDRYHVQTCFYCKLTLNKKPMWCTYIFQTKAKKSKTILWQIFKNISPHQALKCIVTSNSQFVRSCFCWLKIIFKMFLLLQCTIFICYIEWWQWPCGLYHEVFCKSQSLK